MSIENLSQPQDSNDGKIVVQFINGTGTGFAARLRCDNGTTLAQICESQGVSDPSRFQITVNNLPANAAEYVLQDGDRIVASVANMKGA